MNYKRTSQPEVIAKSLGISVWRVKEALGIPLKFCPLDTIKKARLAYNSSPASSEASRAAFLKWVELFMKQVAKITTLEEVKVAFISAPPDPEAKKAIFLKHDELSSLLLQEALTVEEVRIVHDSAIRGSNAQNQAFLKWRALSLEGATKASTAGEAKIVYFSSPPNMKIKRITFLRWVSLCATPDEALDAYEEAPTDVAAINAASRRLNKLALQELENAHTLSEVQHVFFTTLGGRRVEKKALQKWFSLCTNLLEVRTAYACTPRGSEEEKIAIQRINELIYPAPTANTIVNLSA